MDTLTASATDDSLVSPRDPPELTTSTAYISYIMSLKWYSFRFTFDAIGEVSHAVSQAEADSHQYR